MPTQKFQIGNTVRCNTQSNIRSSPGIQTDNKLGTQPLGATGTVVEGPVPAGAHLWWRINFDGGVDGWCLVAHQLRWRGGWVVWRRHS